MQTTTADMLVRILKQHLIGERLLQPNDVVELESGNQATPFMEGLDDEGKVAVKNANIRAFARWLDPQHTQMLDDPPIPRPLEENQPVPKIPGTGGPR